MSPLVSVIVPVWNGARYLDAALQSIWQQGVSELQVIVVNDGSTDETKQMLDDYGTAVTTIHQSNQGPAAARNAGLQHATGEFVAFLDADDVWANGRLQPQITHLQTNPQTDIVQGKIQYMRQMDNEWQPYGEPFFALSLVTGLFRRALFAQVGPLDESLLYCEDVDWFFRAKRCAVTIQQETAVALYYRQHTHNLTKRRDLIHQYTLRVLMKHKQTEASVT